jgi:hypothetical protein
LFEYNPGSNLGVYWMLSLIMFTKRIILLIIGIVVAIAICFSTSLFGMKIATALTPKRVEKSLESYPDFVFVTDRYVDWEAVITKF